MLPITSWTFEFYSRVVQVSTVQTSKLYFCFAHYTRLDIVILNQFKSVNIIYALTQFKLFDWSRINSDNQHQSLIMIDIKIVTQT